MRYELEEEIMAEYKDLRDNMVTKLGLAGCSQHAAVQEKTTGEPATSSQVAKAH